MTKIFNPDAPGRTAELREVLAGLFKGWGIEAYYFRAAETARFPYVVYELRSVGSLEDSDRSFRYVMEINAYTDGAILQLENLFDYLEEHFNQYVYRGNILVEVRLAFGRIDVEEDEPLKRKRILFEVNYWPEEM